MEVQAALLVELLRGGKVQRFAANAAAKTIGRDVAERTTLPGVAHRENQAAITTHENILVGFRKWGGSGVRPWFADLARNTHMASSARCIGRIVGHLVSSFSFSGGNFGLCSRSLFHDYRGAQQKAAEAEGKSVVEAVVVQVAVAAHRSQVRVIEAQAGHILKIGAVEIDRRSIGAMNDAGAVVRPGDWGADSDRGVRSRLDMHAGMCSRGGGVRSHGGRMAGACRNGCASALRGSKRRNPESD